MSFEAALQRIPTQDVSRNGTVSASMSMATTGLKLTYTCPAGKTAFISLITIVTTSGSFTTGQWQILLSGSVISTLAVGAILNNMNQGFGIILSAGQTLSINCAVAQAAITAQGFIFAEERYNE